MESFLTFGIDSGPLNNREIATITWLTVAFAYVLGKSKLRSNLLDIARTLRQPAILIPITMVVAWIALLVMVGHRVGAWSTDLVKETIIFAFGSAIAMLLRVTDALRDRDHFRKILVSTFSVTIVVTYLIDRFVFPLAIEFLLQPIILILAAVAALARGPSQHGVRRFAKISLAVIGLGLIIYAGYSLLESWSEVANVSTIREFALPIWLTLGTVPFIYAMTLYAAYESAYLRMKAVAGDGASPKRGLIALIIHTRLRFRDATGFHGYWARRTAEVASLHASSQIIREFYADMQETRDREQQQGYQLKRNAGLQGAGEDGKQLDQREFEETKRALTALHTAQMGWHRNRGGLYREELLTILESRFAREGLPAEHRIELHVSADGQAWWAWRRTITGWCFAIGAAGPHLTSGSMTDPILQVGFQGKTIPGARGGGSTPQTGSQGPYPTRAYVRGRPGRSPLPGIANRPSGFH